MNNLERAYSTTPSCYLEGFLAQTDVQIEQAYAYLETLLVTKNALESVLRSRNGEARSLCNEEHRELPDILT